MSTDSNVVLTPNFSLSRAASALGEAGPTELALLDEGDRQAQLRGA